MKHCIIIFLVFLVFSCKKEEYVPIDVSSISSFAMSSQWVVITDPYVSYKTEPNTQAAISSYGRIGDVEEVVGTSLDEKNVLWYKFENGWLVENAVRVYANKLQANYAAQKTQ